MLFGVAIEAEEVMEAVVGTVICELDVEVVEVFACNELLEAEVVAITLATLATVLVDGGLSLVHISATHCAQGSAA